jgi:hypothetical protein
MRADIAYIQKLTNGEGRFRQDVANRKAGEHRSFTFSVRKNSAP